AATHRNLEEMVAKGEFREDLFYRLNVVPVHVPALRDRADDIEALAHHFARALGAANGKPGMTFEPRAVSKLRGYSWPGNVRQLQNLVERLVVLVDGDVIASSDVDRELSHGAPRERGASMGDAGALASLDSHRQEAEKEALLRALSRAKNNRSVAA